MNTPISYGNGFLYLNSILIRAPIWGGTHNHNKLLFFQLAIPIRQLGSPISTPLGTRRGNVAQSITIHSPATLPLPPLFIQHRLYMPCLHPLNLHGQPRGNEQLHADALAQLFGGDGRGRRLA